MLPVSLSVGRRMFCTPQSPKKSVRELRICKNPETIYRWFKYAYAQLVKWLRSMYAWVPSLHLEICRSLSKKLLNQSQNVGLHLHCIISVMTHAMHSEMPNLNCLYKQSIAEHQEKKIPAAAWRRALRIFFFLFLLKALESCRNGNYNCSNVCFVSQQKCEASGSSDETSNQAVTMIDGCWRLRVLWVCISRWRKRNPILQTNANHAASYGRGSWRKNYKANDAERTTRLMMRML